MAKPAVIAKVTAAPGKRPELLDVMGGLFAAAEAEAGTEVYVMHADAGNDDVVWFYELYADQDALGAHSTSDSMKAVGAKLAGLVTPGGFELTFLSPVRAKGISV